MLHAAGGGHPHTFLRRHQNHPRKQQRQQRITKPIKLGMKMAALRTTKSAAPATKSPGPGGVTGEGEGDGAAGGSRDLIGNDPTSTQRYSRGLNPVYQ